MNDGTQCCKATKDEEIRSDEYTCVQRKTVHIVQKIVTVWMEFIIEREDWYPRIRPSYYWILVIKRSLVRVTLDFELVYPWARHLNCVAPRQAIRALIYEYLWMYDTIYALCAVHCSASARGPPSHNGSLVWKERGKKNAVHKVVGWTYDNITGQ